MRRCGSCAGRAGRRCTSRSNARGADKLIELDVVRDEIHIPTVRAAFMLNPTTGYILLSDFGENTDQELGRALRDLIKGMRRLVFDLRGNPGGALDQALRVANRFSHAAI